MACAYGGMFFVAGSILLFQIAMTRVFAIMMWHHFSYMVISLALVGFGAAGSILTARRDALKTEPPFRSLTRYATAYGMAAIGAFLLTTRIPVDSLELWSAKSNLLLLFLIFLVLAVPFVLGGMVIGMALTRLASHVSRLYFADLLGSAVGAAASTVFLAAWGTTATVMTAGAAGFLAALLFSLAAPLRSPLVPGLCLAASIVSVAAFSGAGGAGLVPALAWEIPFGTGKEMRTLGLEVDVRLPSATAEVQISQEIVGSPWMGGEFGWRHLRNVPYRVVTQDGTAPTMLIRDAASIDSFPFLDDSQAASAFLSREATGKQDPDVLVIGVGGGIDVMVALAHGAKRVTAVEVNPAMIRMVTDVFADYTGRLLRPGGHALADRIELIQDEGRSYVRHSHERFDVIQLSGVDTFTALSTGAYTLSESYLYTVEAVQDLYDRLTEDGFINYSRFMLKHPLKPRETVRLANIALTALSELGVEDPASHITVFQGRDWASTMIKRRPFTRMEIDALDRFAARQGFMGLVFDPLHDPDAPFPPSRAAAPRLLPAITEHLRETLLPKLGVAATDGEELLDHASALWEVVRARASSDEALFQDALAEFANRFPEDARLVAREQALRVSEDGAPFAIEEAVPFDDVRRGMSTLMRGSPEERQRFMDDYEYDLSASRDDRPFFFNYYKYSGLWRRPDREGATLYHPGFPVGHMVLIGSLVQIFLLAVLLIVLPIRRVARTGLATTGKLRYFAYFSALGLGFMFIEIVMMQKMLLFLGHPTYALSIVLAALLAAAGIGSLLSGNLAPGRRTLAGILGAIVATTLVALLTANHLLPHTLGKPLGLRIAFVTLTLAPLGVVLGMAFPMGIRIVSARSPALLPWCWAINGVTSVFGSLFCILLAIEIGFSAVMLLAAAVYVVGFLAMLREFGAAGDPAPARADAWERTGAGGRERVLASE